MTITRYVTFDEEDAAAAINAGNLYLTGIVNHIEIDMIDLDAEVSQDVVIDDVITKLREFADKLDEAYNDHIEEKGF
jgi:hypothetical protein